MPPHRIYAVCVLSAPCLPLKYVCGGSFYPFLQPFLCLIHPHAHDRCLRFFKHFFSRVRCALAWCVVWVAWCVCELFWLSCVCIVLAPKFHVLPQCGCCVRATFVLGAFCAPFSLSLSAGVWVVVRLCSARDCLFLLSPACPEPVFHPLTLFACFCVQVLGFQVSVLLPAYFTGCVLA